MIFVYWIIFGLIAGTIANFLMPSMQGGIVSSVILGIVGAILGGFIGQWYFGVGITGFNLMSFGLAILGSLIVLFLGRMLLPG